MTDGGADGPEDAPTSDRTPVPEDELGALLASLALKDETRTGWQLRGVADPESVAAHTWGVCLLVLLYADRAGVDRDRALRMAVLHDLAEADTGDHPTRADPSAETIDPDLKERRERTAIEDLLGPFEGGGAPGADGTDEDTEGTGATGADRLGLWEAYEARETPEAAFVKDMDLVDMCLQAAVYETGDRYEPAAGEPGAFATYEHLDEFFATAEPRLRTDVGRALFDAAKRRYTAARDG